MRLIEIYNVLLKNFGKQNWWPVKSKNPEFEIVIGAILTQQSTWKNVEDAIKKLKQKNLLTPRRLANADLQEIEKIIRSTGFYKQKAKRIIDFSRYLEEKYSGNIRLMFAKKVDDLRKELLSLNGIGKETADSIILYAVHKPIFVVDAYTYRFFSRLGMITGKESYDELREKIEKEIKPNEKIYNEFHALIVQHGKKLCKKKPLCSYCPFVKDCDFGKSFSKNQPM